MKKFYFGFAGLLVFVASVSITMGYFWDSQNQPWSFFFPGQEDTPVLGADTSTNTGTSFTTPNKWFNPGDPLRWLQITAELTEAVPDSVLAFTLDGKETTVFQAGVEYFIAEKNAYRNFSPLTLNDIVRLQLPNVPLTPVGEFAAFVKPASTWIVPANIVGKVRYSVNFRDEHYDQASAPAGTMVNDVFTLWIVPWN